MPNIFEQVAANPPSAVPVDNSKFNPLDSFHNPNQQQGGEGEHSAVGAAVHGLGQLISNGLPLSGMLEAAKKYGIDLPTKEAEEAHSAIKEGRYGDAALKLLKSSPGISQMSNLAKDAWDAS